MPFRSADCLLSLPTPSNELDSFGVPASSCQLQLGVSVIEFEDNEEQLTRCAGAECAHPCGMILFILSANLSYGLVACCKQGDRGERKQKRGGACNPPLTENYAEVVGVPCEEHLIC